ncbi:MAG: PHP domain-containing protein [Defluviitaleaceae bacterium]|nr:PHP domain-containing protein [Defluviitaleaceae bacterium]
MLFDAHVHSLASPDSEMDPREAIFALKQKGLGVVFTEHVDYVISEGRDPGTTDAYNGQRDFVCDFNIYPSQYKSLRSSSTLLGLEVGLTAAYFSKNKATAAGDYDFILGSIHSVYGRDVYFNFPEDDTANFIADYLKCAREMIAAADFIDAFGHIDYVARYTQAAQQLFLYENYPQEFDSLLKTIAQRGLAIEINSARFNQDAAAQKLLPIYHRFKQLGGKYCTLGSDAHDMQRLGRDIDKAHDIAQAAGLQPVYFKERKMIL